MSSKGLNVERLRKNVRNVVVGVHIGLLDNFVLDELPVVIVSKLDVFATPGGLCHDAACDGACVIDILEGSTGWGATDGGVEISEPLNFFASIRGSHVFRVHRV